MDATSKVADAQAYGSSPRTLAQSYIQAHDDEYESFRAFARLYPDTVLLAEMDDTLAGIRKVIELARELGPAVASVPCGSTPAISETWR